MIRVEYNIKKASETYSPSNTFGNQLSNEKVKKELSIKSGFFDFLFKKDMKISPIWETVEVIIIRKNNFSTLI